MPRTPRRLFQEMLNVRAEHIVSFCASLIYNVLLNPILRQNGWLHYLSHYLLIPLIGTGVYVLIVSPSIEDSILIYETQDLSIGQPNMSLSLSPGLTITRTAVTETLFYPLPFDNPKLDY